MLVDRRDFLKFGVCSAACAAFPYATYATEAKAKEKDPNLAAFVSDFHVNGANEGSVFQREYLGRIVAKILRLKILPARVVCFGDVAALWGMPEDYAKVRELLQPLVEVGINVTLGMGNHDLRDNFLAEWPEYAGASQVGGRIVSVVPFPSCDLLLLDSANSRPIAKGGGAVTGGEPYPGELGKEQVDWLVETLRRSTKPVLVGAHHKPGELKIVKRLIDAPACAGFIHGHYHRWLSDYWQDGWANPRVLPSAGLPSTGHWGDIGFALFHADAKGATLTCVMEDFFFPRPTSANPRPPLWEAMRRDKNGQRITFPF